MSMPRVTASVPDLRKVVPCGLKQQVENELKLQRHPLLWLFNALLNSVMLSSSSITLISPVQLVLSVDLYLGQDNCCWLTIITSNGASVLSETNSLSSSMHCSAIKGPKLLVIYLSIIWTNNKLLHVWAFKHCPNILSLTFTLPFLSSFFFPFTF